MAHFLYDLFKKGIVVPLTDSYIALLAIENNVPIIHRDKHFDLIARKTSLKILKPNKKQKH
ncbi:MAG: hypothetical protein AMJ42_00370 [Deltaproteobacteria bacterium DG_8]|nr:MAG: hypothetical protein AMJ42_00370 [Deltaproteobacteria bacterium DG_8]